MALSVITTTRDWRAMARAAKSIGFVPTMGALHAGHMSLVARARAANDCVVTSIYVNPTQFNNAEDLANYPVTFEQDCAMLEAAGCDYVFAPTYESMYPDQYRYRVVENEMSAALEGAFRPGHFDGMLSVVLKLLNAIGADRAYFGEKDFQQLALVRGMVEAFQLRTQIVACETMREADGLAMSSRNRRLNPAQRALAGEWSRLLADFSLSCADVRTQLASLGFRVDYVEERWGRRLGAVHTPTIDGGAEVRLIDNVALPATSANLQSR